MPAIDSFRRCIDPSDCDFLGHMNVSRYFQACSDAMFAMQSEIGLTRSDMESGRRLSFAVVNAQSDFRTELMAGDVVYMKTGVIEIGGKSATFLHRLFRAEGDVLAFESRFKAVMFDIAGRCAVAVPDDLRTALARLKVTEDA